MVDVANLYQRRYFGDEEDITFKEEKIALNGFEIGFETRVSISARGGLVGVHILIRMKMDGPLAREASRTNNFLAS